ncbi:hypothetical protein [Chryseobacterium sp.]|uniref:hypothetical protein n=1 Tax=Chryseobacterium sp. TaxID=1871047 RepID=UPI0025B9DCFF|nr:hypothetical protein [Chryseobacterium sp.]MBV8325022.1 hypothetical protein [Chryseobacterium sp.]
MKQVICLLMITMNTYLYSQSSTEIPEIVITKNKTTKTEKKLKVKWLLKEKEELVTFIPNPEGEDHKIKEISFRIANLSAEKNTIIIKVYSQKDHLPSEEIYSKKINLDPKEEANKISFNEINNLFRKDGIFIGFEYGPRKDNEGIYVFTGTVNNPSTYIRQSNSWSLFMNENAFLQEQFRKVDIYLKVK